MARESPIRVSGDRRPSTAPLRCPIGDFGLIFLYSIERNAIAAPGPGKRPNGRRKQAPMPPPDETLTLRQAAAEFGVSVRTLHRFRSDGRLPGVRLGRAIRVRREDVERAVGWKDPSSLLRTLLATDDRAPLDAWMEGWKQLTRLTASDPDVAKAWITWADAAVEQNRGYRVGDYRIRHLIRAAEAGERHAHIDLMVHSMRSFGGDTVARDALRSFFAAVTPWTRA
jgi:excisionase family DNA binding protein